MSFGKIDFADFMDQLCARAKYGIRGEKPLALIAVLKYCVEKGITCKCLLELLPPETGNVRLYFMKIAEKYGAIKNPSSSWSVITGSNRELQIAIRKNKIVNKAFSKLSLEGMKFLLEKYINQLKKGQRLPL